MKPLTLSSSIPWSILSLVLAAQPVWADADKVARGKYLVTIAVCNDCHTPLKSGPDGDGPDMERMLSGHPQNLPVTHLAVSADSPWPVAMSATNTAWSGPWGVSFTANLTPDPETGIGRWTLRNFKDTLRSGRHLGRGRASCRRCRSQCTSTSRTRTWRRFSATFRVSPRSATGCPSRCRRPSRPSPASREMRRRDRMKSTPPATHVPAGGQGRTDPSAGAVTLARRFLERVWGPGHDLDAIDDHR